MKALTFLINLQEPVLATQPHSGEANSRTSFPFIPGSMVRGALIRKYAIDNTDPLLDDKFRRLFFSDSVCFLNAYPAHPKSGARMLPKPLSWLVEKDQVDDPEEISDFALKINEELDKPAASRGEFCHVEDGVAHLEEVKFKVTVHNANNDRNMRGEGESQVFRYEALAAELELAGVILAEEEADLLDLKPLLEQGALFLGGAHTGGYGKVTISNLEVNNAWQEYAEEDPFVDDEAREIVTITLLSDAIVRDENGNILLDIAKAFAVERPVYNGEAGNDSADPSAFRAYTKPQLIGGFNRKWGLPLTQYWTLAAGSVFRCPADKINRENLDDYVERGIGDRRNEGFGRIAVNWQTLPELEVTKAEKIHKSPGVTLSPKSSELAEKMVKRLLRNQLETELIKLLDQARTMIASVRPLPTSAQLSRVRVAARYAHRTGELEKITKHMDFIKEHGAKEDWQYAEFEGRSFFEWVIDMSKMSSFEEKFLRESKLPKIAGKTAQVDDELRTTYLARYIDGVMKLGVKQNQARKGER